MSRPEHIANIGDRGARRRFLSGVAWLIVSVGLVALLVAAGAPRWTRLTIAVPVALSAIGFLQARERT